jgi:hypothetical protein
VLLYLPLIFVERILEIQNHPKHYKINDKVTCNLALELKYGTSVEVVPMDRVSNVDFNEVRRDRRSSRTPPLSWLRASSIVSRSPGRLLA